MSASIQIKPGRPSVNRCVVCQVHMFDLVTRRFKRDHSPGDWEMAPGCGGARCSSSAERVCDEAPDRGDRQIAFVELFERGER